MFDRLVSKLRPGPKVTQEQMALANTLFIEPDSGLLSHLKDKLLAAKNGGIQFAIKNSIIYLAPEEKLFNFDAYTLSGKFRIKDKELIFDLNSGKSSGEVPEDLRVAARERVRLFLATQGVNTTK